MTVRSRSIVAALAGAFLLAAVPCDAADPTPAAIQDLSKPAFDTTTPQYDMAGRAAKSAGTVVAEVDGRTITLADLGDAIRELPPSLGQLSFEQLFPGVVERLIRQQALVIRAQHQGLDEDPVVRRRMKAAADRVLADELLQREIGKTITEQALLARYAETVKGKPGPEEVRVRLIMVASEAEAMAIIAELKAGGDFAAIAVRSSKDATASAGGEVGFVQRDGLNPEVGAVVFSLPVGQFTPYPVSSLGAWFIVRAEERRRQPTPPFAVVRERLRQELVRAGVPAVTEAAMKDVFARQFNINGRDVGGSEMGSITPQ